MDCSEAREILSHNCGFASPEKWVQFALEKHFKKVPAVELLCCPDCSSTDKEVLGQFVYYSNLVRLQECLECQLVYVDVRVDPGILRSHFEATYKDETYFKIAREPIFTQIAEIVNDLSPSNGNLIDIGGATGILAGRIQEARSDIDILVTDISEVACKKVQIDYGLKSKTASISELLGHDETYDAVLMIDVAYYEADIRALWSAADKLTKPGGILVLRVPNKIWLIKLIQKLRRTLLSEATREMDARIPLFNPEHLFVFKRDYVHRRLIRAGFESVTFLPSSLLSPASIPRILIRFGDLFLKLIWKISRGRLTLSPSVLVLAFKPKGIQRPNHGN